MKILAISDTHGFHSQFTKDDFDGIDMIIHAGDESNYKNPGLNANESEDFFRWYNELPVKYKIFVAGNHSTAIEAGLINPRHYESIVYLEHESTTIEGINIFGSPYTPAFCNWSYNIRRSDLDKYWKEIPENTDILITHGPPKGILDLAYDGTGKLEYCGDAALLKHILRVNPVLNVFGHIHNNDDNINAGRRNTHKCRTEFVNASCVTDNKFNLGLTSRGIIIEY